MKIIAFITGGLLSLSFYGYVRYITTHLTTTAAFRQDAQTLESQRTLLAKYNAQKIDLTTNDNKNIAVLVIERPQAKKALVVCHPYRQNKEFLASFVELFPDYTIALFDFRGHGDSDKAPISFGIHEYQEVLTIAQYMKNKFPNLTLHGLGISMGGGALLHATIKQAPFDSIIIDSSFNNLESMLTRALKIRKFPQVIPNFAIPFILSSFEKTVQGTLQSMDLTTRVHECKIPLLVLHDQDDALCPHTYASTLHSLWQGDKSIHTFINTPHAFAFSTKPEEYTATINNFLERI
jgi:pimeloyl-ACP methyl ester carboxylesterase